MKGIEDEYLLSALQVSIPIINTKTDGQAQLDANIALAASALALELEFVRDATAVRLAGLVAGMLVLLAKSRGGGREDVEDESGGTHFAGCHTRGFLVVSVRVSCCCCCCCCCYRAGVRQWYVWIYRRRKTPIVNYELELQKSESGNYFSAESVPFINFFVFLTRHRDIYIDSMLAGMHVCKKHGRPDGMHASPVRLHFTDENDT